MLMKIQFQLLLKKLCKEKIKTDGLQTLYTLLNLTIFIKI